MMWLPDALTRWSNSVKRIIDIIIIIRLINIKHIDGGLPCTVLGAIRTKNKNGSFHKDVIYHFISMIENILKVEQLFCDVSTFSGFSLSPLRIRIRGKSIEIKG